MLNRFTRPGVMLGIELQGELAYVRMVDRIYIVSHPSEPPHEVGHFDTSSGLGLAGDAHMEIVEDAGRRIAYFSTLSGLAYVDVTDPRHPGAQHHILSRATHTPVAVGTRLFVGHGCGVAVLDVSQPDAPTIVADVSADDCAGAGGLALAANQLFLGVSRGTSASNLDVYNLGADGSVALGRSATLPDFVPPGRLHLASGLL